MIVELVSAIAVIWTLIYLAKQIKDSTNIAASNARQAISESLLSNTITYFSDSEFRSIFNKHLKGEELKTEQILYLATYSYFFFRSYENIHYQYRNKLVSTEDWGAFRTNLKALCQTPALRDFWKRENQNFNKSFQAEVSKIFQELNEEPTLMPDALFQPKNKSKDS
ncbi:hypothetical protein [Marinoscillum sp. MHG1-6]|uniref:hypothetical protein n=1 Tax=Marinoscillum sp. MHG1-6 TaxID=2959627 RepID=UPI002157314F|nr:hypothetical protein [Marinoscillum sp. MHG1-6]